MRGKAHICGMVSAAQPPGTLPGTLPNNFDLMRLYFALSVFFVHAYDLSLVPELHVLRSLFHSGIAVESFFVLSGFLVFMSYERSSSLKRYWEKRLRRIYPAYAAVILFSAAIGSLLSSLSTAEYFSWDLLRYLGANLVFLNFLEPSLPGVFDSHPVQAVNGALWTIKVEVSFYLAVPVLVWLVRRFKRRWTVIAVLYILSIVWAESCLLAYEQTQWTMFRILARQLPGQLAFFMSGALFTYYFKEFSERRHLILSLGLIFLAADVFLDLPGTRPLGLAIVVLYAGYALPYLGNFGKYGDMSYGAYLVHCPLIQLLFALGLFGYHPWLALLAALAGVLSLAMLSWHFIEKPMLGRSSHYRRAQREALS